MIFGISGGLALFLTGLLITTLAGVLVVDSADVIDLFGAFDLMFHLIIAGGDVLGEGIDALGLAGFIGGLQTIELRPLRQVTREWVDGSHYLVIGKRPGGR